MSQFTRVAIALRKSRGLFECEPQHFSCGATEFHLFMAHIVMAYIVLACIVMADVAAAPRFI